MTTLNIRVHSVFQSESAADFLQGEIILAKVAVFTEPRFAASADKVLVSPGVDRQDFKKIARS
jgi:hypothetical protein